MNNLNILKLESGKEYTIKQIFSGGNKILIPDMQRDYCWGSDTYDKEGRKQPELISGFVNDLVSLYKNNMENILLGLIYGYENPKYYIHLCDGQQRLTTLFLLLGVINRRSEGAFESQLVFEEDKEPRLQYAIRESTLYFMNDLTNNYFCKNSVVKTVADIEKQLWWFSEYELDRSIMSMCSAIKTIDEKLNDPQFLTAEETKEFGNFVLNNIKLLYYDMGDRIVGEETFVIINTTGEPLTASENLKPILIGGIEDTVQMKKRSDEWEEREEWFWKNINRDEEKTSDKASEDFYKWYLQIIRLQDDVKLSEYKSNQDNSDIDLGDIHSYFKALKKVVEYIQQGSIINTLKPIGDKNKNVDFQWLQVKERLNIVLPLIAYMEKFPNAIMFEQFVRRLRKNHFDDKRKREKYKSKYGYNGGYVDWRHIIQIIIASETEEDVFRFDTSDTSQFKKIPNVNIPIWYDDDERTKSLLNNREAVEGWEDHEELMGDLTPLWAANKNASINYDNTKQIFETFSKLSDCMIEDESCSFPILSNYLRLYKVLLGYPKIGHVDYCSWDIEGVKFSDRNLTRDSYFEFLYDKKYTDLFVFEGDKLLNELKCRISQIAQSEDLFNLTEESKVQQHIKLWLLLKVLYAEKKDMLLSFYDYMGLASYREILRNKLEKDLPFSMANSICGYAQGSRAESPIRYYFEHDLPWFLSCKEETSNALDSPLDSVYIEGCGTISDQERLVKLEKRINEINADIDKLKNALFQLS